MKKVFIAVLALMLAGFAFATVPGFDAVNGNYMWGIDSTLKGAAWDTLAGTSDTAIIASNLRLNGTSEGWQYILAFAPLTGTSTIAGGATVADTVKARIEVIGKDGNGNTISKVLWIDSLTDANSKNIVFPAGGSMFGLMFDIKLESYAANGGQVILNRVYMLKRKVIQTFKNW